MLIVVAAIVQFAIITPMAITAIVKAVGGDLDGLSYLPEINDALDDGGGLLTESVPDDWGRVPAPSGRISIAVDTGWAFVPGSADTGVTADGDPVETIGAWTNGSLEDLAVMVFVFHDPSVRVSMQDEAHFVFETMADQFESSAITGERRLATSRGFVAWEIQGTGESTDGSADLTVIAVSTGDEVVDIYAHTTAPDKDPTAIARTIAQSITVEDGG